MLSLLPTGPIFNVLIPFRINHILVLRKLLVHIIIRVVSGIVKTVNVSKVMTE